MLRGFKTAIMTTTLLALAATRAPVAAAGSGELCSLPSGTLTAAAAEMKDCAFALNEVSKHAIATWYTDRESKQSGEQKLTQITSSCAESSRVTLVVYGMPQKDCEAGYSSSGYNQSPEDYKAFIKTLADKLGQRKALLVLEPDAVGLMAKGGCGLTAGYGPNLKMAIETLSRNLNADIYVDVGYWVLMNPTDAGNIAKVVKELAQAGRVKGISLNTSNYRSNKEISDLCGNFQKAYGDDSMRCIADTSRNFKEPKNSEWCNAKFGAIGHPPTSQTGFSNLDYFVWIKPVGESDGTCDGQGHTDQAMQGPAAGKFFKEHFMTMWNEGYFVVEKKMPKIDGTIKDPETPKPTQPIDQPTKAPEPTSATPVTTAPPAPTTTAPATTAPPTPTTTMPTTTAPPTPTSKAPIDQQPPASSVPATTAPPTSTSKAPIDQQQPSQSPSTPVSSQPATAPVNPQPPSPAKTESGDLPQTSTPAPTRKQRKHRRKKDCASGLESMPEGTPKPQQPNTTAPVTQPPQTQPKPTVTPAPTLAPTPTPKQQQQQQENKALSFSFQDESENPPAPPAPNAAVRSSTESTTSSGLGGGVVAAIVVAAVAVVGVVGMAARRVVQHRRRADTLRTPAEFGQLRATPSGITVI
ncbi:hypothetical protein P43SY_000817 [Pythium insidiosum]|uniref:Glycoside hydrolase n=1 Tax=Pythium insidiosum TaxID=114742 RepID=A0AAD5M8D4_PYTIN|nr:hypothetical protein P43SY_000817 [Pythium insidiosum]